MAIVSSTYTLDGPMQADGAQGIREEHTDSVGVIHVVNYNAPVSVIDYQAVANARGLKIADRLAEAEFTAVING